MGNYGPNCDASLGVGGDGDDNGGSPPAAGDPPATWDSYELIAVDETCASMSATRLGFLTEGVSTCAAACYNLGGCELFYYDPNDGECLKEGSTSDCPDSRIPSSWYDFYALVPEAAPPVAGDGDDRDNGDDGREETNLPYSQIGEGQQCSG